MGDSKPFRTVEQQIAILESRGVSFQDEGYAASFLLRENYYAVVNGYKDALIDKQETNLAKEDRYVRGTDFRHFELMYEFDKRWNLGCADNPQLLRLASSGVAC